VGTKWITGDVITFARMNQKTLIVQAAEPAIMYAGMYWVDTDDNMSYQRVAANNAWHTITKEELAYTITGLWTFDRGAAPPFACAAGSTQVVNLIADDHAASHENAGGDEISVAALSGLLADDQHVLDAEVLAVAAALVHAARHKDGGADELDVSELAGAIGAAGEVPETDGAAVTWVDPDLRYEPKVHAPTHKDGGTDELDVSELAGAIGGAGEIPETDGAAVSWVEPDGRYDPKAHQASHNDGGADEIEIDDLPGANGAAGEIVESDGAAMSFVEPDGRYDPKGHAASHADGAADEIDAADLAGTGGAAGEIIESDGDALSYVEPDGRYTPAAHATTHESGGADETRNIELNPGLADETGSGLLALVTVGEAVVTGDTLFLQNDGKYWKSDANQIGTMPVKVIVIDATIAQDATGTVMHEGYYRNDDRYNWTPGAGAANLLFASAAALGSLVQLAAQPAGDGDQVQVCGWIVNANVIYFRPSLELVEIAA